MVDLAVVERSEVDVIWAFSFAQSAFVARDLILCDMENLQLRSSVEDLKEVSDYAERSE